MILIKGGKLCGATSELEVGDILIKDGKIAKIAERIDPVGEMTIINAKSLMVAPGLVDLHVHFRDPGFEYKEDIMTGAAAAAAGGVTTCLCMANTLPVADNVKTIEYILDKAKDAPIKIVPIGAITLEHKGETLTDFAALKAAGVIALSDDGSAIQSAKLVRHAMHQAHKNKMTLISHCEDDELAKNYAVNEGVVSQALGLPGRPAIAEEIMVARDVMLSVETGAKVHIAHVSTAASVAIIRMAKKVGAYITAETCPQYFALTEDEILKQGTNARVNPPLRTQDDVTAIIEGLIDGTIDVIATDHAPHSVEDKAQSLEDAPSGMIGLETSLALALTYLYHTGKLKIGEIIQCMSTHPARIVGLESGVLTEGASADIVMFDPHEQWVVDPDQFKSKARNSPFSGMELKGKVKYTISRGEIVYRDTF
ncbi:MAG: dihydroorotase [Oscillospiraceae bacterium]|nr:dihydroorotase [Oscillospiraceae bacterium]